MLYPGKEVSGYEVLTVHQDVTDPSSGMFIARHLIYGDFRVGYTSDSMSATWSMQSGETFDSYRDAAVFFGKALEDEAFEYERDRNIASRT